jgi:hypothetical protein
MKISRLASLTALGACLFTGCAAPAPTTNWDVRVGSYTYAQVVQKLGEPTRSAKLEDGATLAEWRLGPDTSPTVGYKGLDAGQMDWVKSDSVRVYPAAPGEDQWLRLHFGRDGVLRSWEKFDRPSGS